VATVMKASEAREAILRRKAPKGHIVEGSLGFGPDSLSWLPNNLTVVRLGITHCPEFQAWPRGLRCKQLVLWDVPAPNIPGDVHVEDSLQIKQCDNITELPRGLRLHTLSLDLMEDLISLPADLVVTESFTVKDCPQIENIPPGLRLKSLSVTRCEELNALPDDLQVTDSIDLTDAYITSLPPHLGLTGTLAITSCDELERLPEGLRLNSLRAVGCMGLVTLPDDLRVTQTLDLTGCANLEMLPTGLHVHTLNLTNCMSLRALPEGLRVTDLTLSGCTSLAAWPSGGLPTLRRLAMRDCPALTGWPTSGPATLRALDLRGNTWIRELPSWLRAVDELTVAGCQNLEQLPEKLRVASWLDIADSPLRTLPPSARGFRLRWRGVAIDARSAFHPETVNGKEILKQRNAEVRRVMLERVGYEQFLRQVEAETLDEDEDAGGPRRLLRVAVGQDEPLVCLAVHDPSTGRQYLLRTPPAMRTCHQAAAWIAGFDSPDDYHPLAET